MSTSPHATIGVPEVSEMLGCSDWKVRQMVSAGEIPHLRVGTLIRFRPEAINAWLADRERATGQGASA